MAAHETIVQTLRSFTAGGPAPVSLLEGQLAVNATDKKIWIGNAAGGAVLIYDFADSSYEHPLFTADPGTVLTGAQVFSDHIITDEGHLTSSVIRNLTAADVGAIVDAPADGTTYGRNNSAWVPASSFDNTDVFGGNGISVQQDVPAAGDVTISSTVPQSIKAAWLWEDSGSAANPGDANIGADQSTSANMTQFVMSYVDADGQDISAIAALVDIGDTFLFLMPDGRAMIFDVTAPAIDNVTYAKILVTFAGGDAAINPVASDRVEGRWYPEAADPVAPPHTHDHDGPDILNTGAYTHLVLDQHLEDGPVTAGTNPHQVTAEQVGAVPIGNAYAHPTFPADDGVVLTNAQVYSDHQVSVEGHLIGSTIRNITAADIGSAPEIHGHDAGTF